MNTYTNTLRQIDYPFCMKYDVLMKHAMDFYFLVKAFILWLEKLRTEFSNSASNIPSPTHPNK